jgi:hypothetical protein
MGNLPIRLSSLLCKKNPLRRPAAEAFGVQTASMLLKVWARQSLSSRQKSIFPSLHFVRNAAFRCPTINATARTSLTVTMN